MASGIEEESLEACQALRCQPRIHIVGSFLFATRSRVAEQAPLRNCGRRTTVLRPNSRGPTMSQAVDAGHEVLTTGGRVVSDVLPLRLMPIVHRLS